MLLHQTFLGVKLANVLLSNRKTSLPFKGPLVLISYKNHALDQFLEGLSRTLLFYWELSYWRILVFLALICWPHQ